jgi:hypothetical protein
MKVMKSLASKTLLKETKETQKRLLACLTPCMPACFYSIVFVDLQIGGVCRGALRLGWCVYNRTQGERNPVLYANCRL